MNNNLVAGRITSGLNRRVIGLDTAVLGDLLAVLINPLIEIALTIKQANRDKRQAQIARRLAVIAGQNSETSGIDRKALVITKLGTEIGDEIVLIQPSRFVAIDPLFQVRVVLGECTAIGAKECVVSGCQLKYRLVYAAQEYFRIPARSPPKATVERIEQLTGWPMPAEPEIRGQLTQAPNALGQPGLYV